jgi:hypothetical protein
MNTTNGTDWDKCGNAMSNNTTIHHQQEDAPLWLSAEDIREMLKELEGEE